MELNVYACDVINTRFDKASVVSEHVSVPIHCTQH